MRIENEKVVFEATERAAEITSFILKENGWEAMWQGNPEFWAGRNPILFPIVGSTFDKIIHLDGGEYKMGNHGLLRSAMFTLESSTDNSGFNLLIINVAFAVAFVNVSSPLYETVIL